MDSRRVLTKVALSALISAAPGIAQAQLYWRADLGASYSTGVDLQDNNFAADRVICGDAACTVPGQISDAGTGYVLSGGLGWRFNPNLRVDGTVSYRGGYRIEETMPDGTFLQAYVTSWGMMANGYYDFALAWGKPYLGVGLGWASNRINDVFISKFNGIKHGGTSSGFAWSVKGGVGVPLSPALTLDVAVGYTDLGKLQIDPGAVTSGATTLAIYGGANGKLKAWEASVGLRF